MAECKQEGDEKSNAPYLVVDYGEQLVADFEETRDELHKEILSVIEKVHLQWEVVRCALVLVVPTLGGLGLAFFSQLILPRFLSTWASTIFLCVTLGFVFLNLAPLCDSVSTYLAKTYHSPKFVNCKCARCLERIGSQEHMKGVDPAGVADSAVPEAGDTCRMGLRRRDVGYPTGEDKLEEGLHFEHVSMQDANPGFPRTEDLDID